MELNGIALTESMAIVELLEELHPSPPLNASDLTTRARVREVCEAVNASIHPVQNSAVIRHFSPGIVPCGSQANSRRLDRRQPLEAGVQALVGHRRYFSLADIFVFGPAPDSPAPASAKKL